MNNLSDSYFRLIHGKSAYLEECFGKELGEGKIPKALSLKMILSWEANLTSINRAGFPKRLGWFCEEKKELIAIAAKFNHENSNLSGWIQKLQIILPLYSLWTLDKIHKAPFLKKHKAIPFEELLVPWVDYAIEANIDENGLFSSTAKYHLIRFLIKDLSRLSAPCFQNAFIKFKHRNKHLKKDHYIKFIEDMYQGAIYEFWSEYASLARLLVDAVDRWILSKLLLFRRLNQDYSRINKYFFENQKIGIIKGIETNLSSPHSNEGQVHIIHFQNGQRIVYKPRSSALDIAFEKIIIWINNSSSLLPLKAVKSIDQENYSFQEYIPYNSCTNENELNAYYHRTGQFAALLFALGSTDYHFGNLRANGAFPLLTDNETLFSARIKTSDNFSISGDQCLDESIFHSFAQGHFLIDSARLFFPSSPSIVGVFEDLDRHVINRFSPINRDNMQFRRSKIWRKGNNLAKFKGQKTDPYLYVSDLKSGYRQMSQFIRENSKDFLALIQHVSLQYQMKFRMLLRPSAYYHDILLKALSPELLRNGIDRSIHFEQMAAVFLPSVAEHEVRVLLQTELTMVKSHLIPWFHLQMDQDNYLLPKQNPDISVIKCSSKKLIKHRLQLLKFNANLDPNEDIIDHYLASYYERKDQPHVDSMVQNLFFCYNRLFDRKNIPGSKENDPNKILAYYYLDGGISGVILLLSAWFRIHKELDYKILALKLLEPLEDLVRRFPQLTVAQELGGHRGLGSIINALSLTADYLGEQKVFELADQLIHLGQPDFSNDSSFSTGLAGFLLGVLNLSKLSGQIKYNSLLSDGLQKLSEQKINEKFHNIEFGSGLSGELFVMCKLINYLKDEHHLDQIRRLGLDWSKIVHENWRTNDISFNSGKAGWLLTDNELKAIGIDGFSPLALKPNKTDLEKITGFDTDQFRDGVVGRIEAILLIYKNDLSLMQPMIEKWDQGYNLTGKYQLAPNYLNPSFYIGISGILYQKLRIKYPDIISSVYS